MRILALSPSLIWSELAVTSCWMMKEYLPYKSQSALSSYKARFPVCRFIFRNSVAPFAFT